LIIPKIFEKLFDNDTVRLKSCKMHCWFEGKVEEEIFFFDPIAKSMFDQAMASSCEAAYLPVT